MQERKLKIAVIGSGYVGLRAASYWSKHHDITVTTRNQDRIAYIQSLGLKAALHFPSESASWKPILATYNAILLCIAPSSYSSYKECYYDSAKALKEASLSFSTLPHIVYTSSTSVYKESAGGIVDENSLLDRESEKASLLCQTEDLLLSLHATLLRLSEIYGPEKGPIERLKKGLFYTSPGVTNLIHVEDIIYFAHFAMQHNLRGIFNLCNDTHKNKREFYEKLCSSCQIQVPAATPSVHASNKLVSNKKMKASGYQLIHSEYLFPLATAFSPCPNDTFLFDGWVFEHVGKDIPIYPHLKDVSTLNSLAEKATYPLTKLSFYALGKALEEYVMLPVGSALGFNCGPKIISKEPFSIEDLKNKRIAIPGPLTTAHLLLQLLLEEPKEKIFCTYDEIFTLLENGDVDCGLIIHEQRFVYKEAGYFEIIDLGELWEKNYKLPLPLGCIAAKRSLGPLLLDKLTKALRDSLFYAKNNPQESFHYSQRYAHVKEKRVIEQHIDLYINEETATLSDNGKKAIDTLFTLAHQKNLISLKNKWS